MKARRPSAIAVVDPSESVQQSVALQLSPLEVPIRVTADPAEAARWVSAGEVCIVVSEVVFTPPVLPREPDDLDPLRLPSASELVRIEDVQDLFSACRALGVPVVLFTVLSPSTQGLWRLTSGWPVASLVPKPGGDRDLLEAVESALARAA